MTTEGKPTVVEALAAAMGEVQSVSKTERNTQQGYNFRGVDAVVNAVGPALRNNGVVVVPVSFDHDVELYESRNGARMKGVTARIGYRFYGPAGDYIDALACGEASDSGDKAIPKVNSVAFRTLLLQSFCIPTDDPDPDSMTHERASEQLVPPVTDADLDELEAKLLALRPDVAEHLRSHRTTSTPIGHKVWLERGLVQILGEQETQPEPAPLDGANAAAAALVEADREHDADRERQTVADLERLGAEPVAPPAPPVAVPEPVPPTPEPDETLTQELDRLIATYLLTPANRQALRQQIGDDEATAFLASTEGSDARGIVTMLLSVENPLLVRLLGDYEANNKKRKTVLSACGKRLAELAAPAAGDKAMGALTRAAEAAGMDTAAIQQHQAALTDAVERHEAAVAPAAPDAAAFVPGAPPAAEPAPTPEPTPALSDVARWKSRLRALIRFAVQQPGMFEDPNVWTLEAIAVGAARAWPGTSIERVDQLETWQLEAIWQAVPGDVRQLIETMPDDQLVTWSEEGPA